MRTRIAVLAVAIAAMAFAVLGLVQTLELQRGRSLTARLGRLSAHQQADARRHLDAAALLNPDGDVELARAQLAVHGGDLAGAERRLRAALRREPANIADWMFLASIAHGTDPATAAVARARLRALAPPVPAP